MQEYWVWMRGEILAPEVARVSVFDHAFLYGDSIYETLRTFRGALFAGDDHLDRLEQSAAGIELTLPLERVELKQALEAAAGAGAPGRDSALRLVVTRGNGPIGLDIEVCRDPLVVIYGWNLHQGRHPDFGAGIRAVVADVRRNPPAALDPRIKSGNFLNNILAFREARRAGAAEAILLGIDGCVTEGTTSNVFWARAGRLYTPADEGILSGVTRKHILELCRGEGIAVECGRYSAASIALADEIFITSTLRWVLPVTSLNGRSVGGGSPGPLTRRIADLYEQRAAQWC